MGYTAARIRHFLLSLASYLFWLAFWLRRTPLAWCLRKFGYGIMAIYGLPEVAGASQKRAHGFKPACSASGRRC